MKDMQSLLFIAEVLQDGLSLGFKTDKTKSFRDICRTVSRRVIGDSKFSKLSSICFFATRLYRRPVRPFHSLQAAKIPILSIHDSKSASFLSLLVSTDHSLKQSSRVPKQPIEANKTADIVPPRDQPFNGSLLPLVQPHIHERIPSLQQKEETSKSSCKKHEHNVTLGDHNRAVEREGTQGQ